jgi:23S rRNA (guanosine2251-2'-O)-methyltransferase
VQGVEKSVAVLDEDGLMALVAERDQPLVLVLDCVQDPHNLGAILRTAEGAGVDVVVAPKDKAVGITETVRRVSVGAADRVPFAQVTNLARTMEKLKAAGIWLVGTSDHAAAKSIYELDLRGPLGLVMGAEDKGMRRLTAENCDFLASIPMSGKVECLNVSVATGVCLYEAVRQRRAGT